jgi:hypothetical protein
MVVKRRHYVLGREIPDYNALPGPIDDGAAVGCQ